MNSLVHAVLSSIALWIIPISSIYTSPISALYQAATFYATGVTLLHALTRWDLSKRRVKHLSLTVVQLLGGLLAVTCLHHIILVLFGAPLFSAVGETWSASFYVACLVFPQAYYTCGLTPKFLHPRTRHEKHVYYGWVGAWFGAWLGAIVLPLDWERWWQEWPLPCVFGAWMGHGVGLLASNAM
jgi:phosphatidylinositol glycan class F